MFFTIHKTNLKFSVTFIMSTAHASTWTILKFCLFGKELISSSTFQSTSSQSAQSECQATVKSHWISCECISMATDSVSHPKYLRKFYVPGRCLISVGMGPSMASFVLRVDQGVVKVSYHIIQC